MARYWNVFFNQPRAPTLRLRCLRDERKARRFGGVPHYTVEGASEAIARQIGIDRDFQQRCGTVTERGAVALREVAGVPVLHRTASRQMPAEQA